MRGEQREITVVVATRDRRDHVLRAVQRLRDLPERPTIIVVDDCSSDGTSTAVADAFPDVRVITLNNHRGVTGARNVGVRAATTPYVAFADDDSWWAPGALRLAVDHFHRHPRLGLIAARVLIGDEQRLDPTCVAMAASPLSGDDLPGPRVLGFLACGSVARRSAFLQVDGFPEDYRIMGEEEPLALALTSADWDVAYVEDVIAHHAPHSAPRDRAGRQRQQTRNDLWTAWRYRRPWGALLRTVEILRGITGPAQLSGVAEALVGLPSAVRRRRPIPPHVEHQRRRLRAVAP